MRAPGIRAPVPRTLASPSRRQAASAKQTADVDPPTFEELATEWLEHQLLEGGHAGGGLAAKSREDLEWRLVQHLLPVFGSRRIDEITVRDVDDYRLSKVRGGRLAPSSINKTLTTLATILELGVEYGMIDRNPAQGRRRRLRSVAPTRPWLDRADHIEALLGAAYALDMSARATPGQRRALIATLIFAGLRIGEALALRWEDVDLQRRVIVIKAAKTAAGVRNVNIVPALHMELAGYRQRLDSPASALAFGTSTGRPHGASNIRRRVLAPAVKLANAELAQRDLEPLVSGLTPHSLRRTFASLLFAIGETPPYVMAQMGHTSANLTLSIYARQMLRRDGEPERLRALVEGGMAESNDPLR